MLAKFLVIINFKPFTHPTGKLYFSNKILKITDPVKVINCVFVAEALNKTPWNPFVTLS